MILTKLAVLYQASMWSHERSVLLYTWAGEQQMWLLLHKTTLIISTSRALGLFVYFVQAKEEQPFIKLILFLSLHCACNHLCIPTHAHKLCKITRYP